MLDLFAGTGALGIEALSRGATFAVFIDQAKAALSAIRHNIRELELDDRTRVIRWNILNDLNCLISERQGFDLIFLDPPYETNAVAATLTGLASCGALAPAARVVIEHSVNESITSPIEKMVLTDQRRFGKTLVSFMEAML